MIFYTNFIKMNVNKLNKENPTIEFNLTAEDSYLLIKSVCIPTNKDFSYQWGSNYFVH